MATHCRNYIYTFLFFTSIALPPRPAYDRSAQSHWGKIIHEALLALILAATLSSVALSANITFPNNPLPEVNDSFWTQNYVDTGFRFSPSCHLDFITYMDCQPPDASNNPKYLGPFASNSVRFISTSLANLYPTRSELSDALFLGTALGSGSDKVCRLLRTAPLASSKIPSVPLLCGPFLDSSVGRATDC